MSIYPVPENRILSTIPEQRLRQIAGSINLVTFNEGHVFFRANEAVHSVVFPLKGVISVLVPAGETLEVEALMVGNEGLVGLPLFLGTDSIPWKGQARTPGEAFVMSGPAFLDSIIGNPCLETALRRYTQGVMVTLAQLAVCRGAHPIQKRCARWLLTMQDRLQTSSFQLTQEFFARTLGVRRASISESVGTLQKLGILRHERGQLTILDRDRLERFACPCYQLVQTECARLVPGN